MEYRSVVSGLHYLNWTHPDLESIVMVNHACQFMHSPIGAHLQAVKTLHYRGTIRYKLNQPKLILMQIWLEIQMTKDLHQPAMLILEQSWSNGCPRNSPQLQDPVQNQSTVPWPRQQQNCFGFSGFKKKLSLPQISTPDQCDNISTFSLASNLVFRVWTKHIEINCHDIRELVVKKLKETTNLHKIADLLPKELS